MTINDDVRYAELFSPKLKINAIAGGIIGILLAAVVIFFLEWMQADLLRTPEQLERLTGLVVLGTIPASGQTDASRRRLPLPRIQPEVLLGFGLGLILGAVAFAIISQML